MSEAQKAAGFEFNEQDHSYKLNGLPLLGVNEVIQKAGLSSYADIPQSKLEAAQVRGKFIHKACSLLDSGQLDWNTVDPAILPYVKCWEKFVKDNSVEIIQNEVKVYSSVLLVAGTIDRVVLYRGKPWYLDIKSGQKIAPETKLQLAGYQIIGNEYLNIKGKYRVVVRLTESLPETKEYDKEADIFDFLAALRVVRWKEKNM